MPLDAVHWWLMSFCVCEGKIKDDCDLGIRWSQERPVHVTSPITRAEFLSLIKLEVLIQKCRQSLCCLWWSGVLSYILLLLKASHMAEKKFASHRSVLSEVFFCHVQFYSIRIISFPFLWKRGEGGGRGDRDGEDMWTQGLFISMYDKIHYK